MRQAKVSLSEDQVTFMNDYARYGFKDKSSMVRRSLDLLKESLEREQLKESAELYAEVYEEDTELVELTDVAVDGWPE